MQQFEYKVLWSTHKIGISREMISYKNKNIQESQITGFAIQLVPVTRYALGPGALSYALTKKKYAPFQKVNKNIDFNQLPDKNAQLIIAYKEHGQEKKKQIYLPLFTDNKICIDILNTMKKTFPGKYEGIGMPNEVMKVLGLSMKATWIAFVIIILFCLGITGGIVYYSIR
ncbi:MAG: hypothetical protein O3B47_03690 [bacterium]|nr:hypothetical protein [bacterium]